MRRRSLPSLVIATLALALGAAPAPAFEVGETFLTGGLDLPAGAIAGGRGGWDGEAADRSSVSDDGRFVAFTAQADTLDPAAHPDVANVYRKDRLTGEVVLVSRATGANGAAFAARSHQPSISGDGARVAFRTTAALDAADSDGGRADVYVRDVGAGTTTLATVATGGVQQTLQSVGELDLSGDGGFVVFAVGDGLVAGDANAHSDVYRRNLAGNTTELVSDDAAVGARAGNAASFDPSVSDDGTWVAFASQATDVASPFTAGTGAQIFVRDMTARRTHLVSSRTAATTTGANGGSSEPDIAGAPASTRTDRVVVAYASDATNVAAGGIDGSTASSVYLRRLSPDTSSVLVSRADRFDGANADSRAHTPSISDDGACVVFSSDATNLGAGADYYGVYLRDVAADRTFLASVDNSYAVQGSIAGDGGFVAWYEGMGVTPDSDPDSTGVFGRMYTAPSTFGPAELVSRPPGSAPFLLTAIEVDPNGPGARTVSADGRYVVFKAYSSRLPGGVVGGPPQIYRRDTLSGAIELVSRANGLGGAPAGAFTDEPTVSADGRYVAFLTSASLDATHGDASAQVYVRDLVAGTTTLASRAEGAGGALADAEALVARIGADGRHVAFVSRATNLGAPGGRAHAYVRDLDGAHTTLVDRAAGAGGAIGTDDVDAVSPSADGRVVAFSSRANNLDPDDAGGNLRDVYVRDTLLATTTLASRRSGLAGQHATGSSTQPALSADGTVVAFRAEDETLAPEAGGWGGNEQVVARVLATGANALVSRAPGGTPADDHAGDASVSADGAVVAFASDATNLLPGVGGGTRGGVFARTTATGALSGPPAFGILDNQPQDRASFPSISDDGQCLAFSARGHNAATGLAGDLMTSYVYVVSGACPKPLVALAIRRPVRRARAPGLRARLTNARFRVGRAATAKSAMARAARRRGRRGRPAPVGTTFVVTLTTSARVTIAIERPAQGRLAGRFCRRPSPRLRRNLRCVRFVRVGSIVRRGVRAGRSRIAFSGRIGRRALRPGKHRARVRASNGGGSSRWVRLGFRVVRR